MKLKIVSVAHHRNGISGEPFYAVLFRDSRKGPLMLATVFREEPEKWADLRCAVLNVELAAAGNIRFGENSWRGDYYYPALLAAIVAYEESR